jgi:hypothetical protein
MIGNAMVFMGGFEPGRFGIEPVRKHHRAEAWVMKPRAHDLCASRALADPAKRSMSIASNGSQR